MKEWIKCILKQMIFGILTTKKYRKKDIIDLSSKVYFKRHGMIKKKESSKHRLFTKKDRQFIQLDIQLEKMKNYLINSIDKLKVRYIIKLILNVINTLLLKRM